MRRDQYGLSGLCYRIPYRSSLPVEYFTMLFQCSPLKESEDGNRLPWQRQK